MPRTRASALLLATASLACLAAGAVAGASAEARSRFYLGGIQVNEPDPDRWVEELRAAGMNTVAVTDYARQGDWDSANLWWDEEDDQWVVREIRAAERRGLRTVLVLRVALDHAFPANAFLWHGMIQPRTDADLAEWFRRYKAFASRWAEIAQREGVDLLVIGSEMGSMTATAPVAAVPPLAEYYLDPAKRVERREILAAAGLDDGEHRERLEREMTAQARWAARTTYAGEPRRLERMQARRDRLESHWRDVVLAVRALYDGPLGYAANFDEYQEVELWDALDVMGINAYFPLRQPAAEAAAPLAGLAAELREGWRRVLSEVEAFREERGLTHLPVVFTELGYVPREGTTLAPWAGDGLSVVYGPGGPEVVAWRSQPLEPRERALAVAGLVAANAERERPFLRGLLYWKLSTVPSHREIEPFVLVLGDGHPDPLLPALRALPATVR